jgi:hypothetical protein
MVTDVIDRALGDSINDHLADVIRETLDLTAEVVRRSASLPQSRQSQAQGPRQHGPTGRWSNLIAPFGARTRLRPRLLEVGVFVLTAAGLIAVLTVGGGLLSRSHLRPLENTGPRSPQVSTTTPVATTLATPPSTAAATAPAGFLTCTYLRSPSERFGTRLEPPGPANPRVSCAQILAPLHCPWAADSSRGPCFQGVPPTVELLRVTTSSEISESPSGPGPSFKARNLLAWQITWVPKLCTARPGASLYWALAFPPVPYVVGGIEYTPSPCHSALRYYVDATTGKPIVGSIS